MKPLPEFLRPLEFLTQPFPRRAVEEAIPRRDEATPHLLDAIEWATRHPVEANDEESPYMLHMFALFLLAQFRERRAYPLIIDLFRSEHYESLTGDLAADGLPQILASVCGGDTEPIKALIEDERVDEYVRAAAVSALGVLLHNHVITQAEVSTYFSQLFAGRLAREPGFVWDCLIAVCADFCLKEHLEPIRQIHADGIVDPPIEPLEAVEDRIMLPPAEALRFYSDDYSLIDDTVAQMRHWDCFRVKPSPAKAGNRATDDSNISSFADIQAIPKIGRNDPCPCGSGNKHKKCCGRVGAG